MIDSVDSGKTTPEAPLQSFYDRFDPAHQKFIRSVQAAVRKRPPTANELVYDYASFFVISYSPTDKGIDGIVSIAVRADRARPVTFANRSKSNPKTLAPAPRFILRCSQRAGCVNGARKLR